MITEKNAECMQKKHKLTLDERADLNVSGVIEVEAFSDKEIIVVTVMGKLTIKGENLHIEKVDVESGDFISKGKVSSLVYSRASVNKGSFIERIFK